MDGIVFILFLPATFCHSVFLLYIVGTFAGEYKGEEEGRGVHFCRRPSVVGFWAGTSVPVQYRVHDVHLLQYIDFFYIFPVHFCSSCCTWREVRRFLVQVTVHVTFLYIVDDQACCFYRRAPVCTWAVHVVHLPYIVVPCCPSFCWYKFTYIGGTWAYMGVHFYIFGLFPFQAFSFLLSLPVLLPALSLPFCCFCTSVFVHFCWFLSSSTSFWYTWVTCRSVLFVGTPVHRGTNGDVGRYMGVQGATGVHRRSSIFCTWK